MSSALMAHVSRMNLIACLQTPVLIPRERSSALTTRVLRPEMSARGKSRAEKDLRCAKTVSARDHAEGLRSLRLVLVRSSAQMDHAQQLLSNALVQQFALKALSCVLTKDAFPASTSVWNDHVRAARSCAMMGHV